jgi:hypothetical protein
MKEKTFNNARIIHKGDTEVNWNKAIGFIPRAKEIIIYLPDENYNYCRMKIGDGVNGINELPFVVDVDGELASKEWVIKQAELLGLSLQEYVDDITQPLENKNNEQDEKIVAIEKKIVIATKDNILSIF